MAYGIKYRFSFTSVVAGVNLNTYRVEILQNDFTGVITTVEHAGGEPLIFNRRPIGGNKLEPIYGSTCEVRFAGSPFQYDEFFAVGETEYRVDVYKNSTLDWTGFVLPDQFQIELRTNSVVSIIASDGLELLKDKPVQGYPSTNYGGKIKASTYFSDLFKTMGTPITEFRDATNIRPETIDVDTDSLFNNIYYNIKAFKKNLGEINEELFTWHEFLSAVLVPLGCCIYQANGQWWIVRTQVLGSEFEYYSIAIDGLAETGPHSYFEESNINESKDDNSYILDRSLIVQADDIYKSQKVSFEYKATDNFDTQLIRDGDFAFGDWVDPTTLINWTSPGGVSYERIPVAPPGSSQTIGVQINGKVTSFNETTEPPSGTYMESFDMPVMVNLDGVTFDFSYYAAAYVPDLSPATTTIRIQLILTAGTTVYYYNFSTSSWSTSITYGSESGGGMQKYTHSGITLKPGSVVTPGRIKLRLIQIEGVSSSVEGVQYADILADLQIPDTTFVSEETNESTESRSIVPEEIKLTVSDAPSQHYVNAITLGPNDYDPPTYSWTRKGAVRELDNLTKILAETIMSDEFYNRPTWKLSGTLKGDYKLDSVISYNNTELGSSVKLFTTGVTHYAKSEAWQGEWREIDRDNFGTLDLLAAEQGFLLLTEDGDYIMIE